jgi:hypothetical protein
MTATLERISKNTGALTDREIVKLAAELFNDAVARYHDPDASDDTKAVIGSLYAGFYETFRPQFVAQAKPHIDDLARKVADIHKPKGRVTLNVRRVVTMVVNDGDNSRTIGPDELVRAGYRADQVYSRSEIRQLDLETLEDGQVIDLDLPSTVLVQQQRIIDTSRVALPDNWQADLAGALKTALEQLPAPVVEVENLVETPQVNVEINEAPQEPVEISFDRDRMGLIKSATSKPAAAR